jgi:hypothetical protein
MKSQFFAASWYHISRNDGMQLDLDADCSARA